MKNALPFLFFLLFSHKAIAQFDPLTNVFVSTLNTRDDSPEFSVQDTDTVLTSIPCTQDDFYAVSNTGLIDHYQLSGSTVTSLGNVITRPSLRSISVNNNLDGGNPSPTFYSDSGGSPMHYNVTGWALHSPQPPWGVAYQNCGGYAQYSYYIRSVGGYNADIMQYSGSAWTALYISPPGRAILVADLAVDASGNVYFLVGPPPSSGIYCDSLFIMNPAGQITTRLPFSMDVANVYGSMFIHGEYHLAFGAFNPNTPHCLMPVSVISNTVVTGTPIPFQSNGYADIASCDPGGPKNDIGETSIVHTELIISPNPAANTITFTSESESEWAIFNSAGQVALQGMGVEAISVNVEVLSDGIYFLQVVDEAGEIRKAKFVIEK